MKTLFLILATVFGSSLAHAGDSYLECSFFNNTDVQGESILEYFDRTTESQVSLEFPVPESGNILYVTLNFVPDVKAEFNVVTWYADEDKRTEFYYWTKPVHYSPRTVYKNLLGQRVECQLVD